MLPREPAVAIISTTDVFRQVTGHTATIESLKIGRGTLEFFSGGKLIKDSDLVSNWDGKTIVCVDSASPTISKCRSDILLERLSDRPIASLAEVTSDEVKADYMFLLGKGRDINYLSAALASEPGLCAILVLARTKAKEAKGEGLSLAEAMLYLAAYLHVPPSELFSRYKISEDRLIQIVQTLKNCALAQALSFAAEIVALEAGGSGDRQICNALSLLCAFPAAADEFLRSGKALGVSTWQLAEAQVKGGRFEGLSVRDVFAKDFGEKFGEALVEIEVNSSTFGDGKIVFETADAERLRWRAGEPRFAHALRVVDVIDVRVARGPWYKRWLWGWGDRYRRFALMVNSHKKARFLFVEDGAMSAMTIRGLKREDPTLRIEFSDLAAVNLEEVSRGAVAVQASPEGVGSLASRGVIPGRAAGQRQGQALEFQSVGKATVLELACPETQPGVVETD